MSIRKSALIAVAATLGLLAMGSGSASATTLRADPGNVAFPTGNVTVTNTTSSPALLTTSIGNISCNAVKFHADINNNHATDLTGQLTALTFTACSDTWPVINITSCSLHTPPVPTISIMSTSATQASIVFRDTVVRCAFGGTPQACYLTAATANGLTNNTTSSISFTSVSWTGVAPTTDTLGSFCPSSYTFSTTLTHVVEVGTNRTVTVT